MTLAKQMQWSLSIGLWTICNHIKRIAYWNYCTKDDWPIFTVVGYLRLWALELLLVELPSQCYMPATSQRQEEHFKLLSLLKLITNIYEIDMILEGKDTDFDIWCQEKCDEYCKRCFFFRDVSIFGISSFYFILRIKESNYLSLSF